MNDSSKYSVTHRTSASLSRYIWTGLVLAAIAVFVAGLFFILTNDVTLTLSEQQQLLELAREQLIASMADEGFVDVDTNALSDRLRRDGAAFVSLTVDGALRGCMIDQFESHEPLFANVLRNAQFAIQADDRFAMIRDDEIDAVRIEISLVYDITTLTFEDADDVLDRLVPTVHGVILGVDDAIATYLPSVWGIFPDPAEFLSQLCIKGGWDAQRWRVKPYPLLQTYRVFEFAESE